MYIYIYYILCMYIYIYIYYSYSQVIVFMLGSFPADLQQDPCLGLYITYIQHLDRYMYIECSRHLLLCVDGYELISVSFVLSHVLKLAVAPWLAQIIKSIVSEIVSFGREIRERFAKGPRKVRERRILPHPTLAQRECDQIGAPFFHVKCVGPHRNTDLPNAINSVFFKIRVRKDDHIHCPDSAGAWKVRERAA